MRVFKRFTMVMTVMVLGLAASLGAAPASAQTVICYNCPTEWADWGTQVKKIKEALGITVPNDNKNSGQSLAQIVAEKGSPVADIVYLGVTFGIDAKRLGVIQPYKPKRWDEIPNGLKDPDGDWFSIHSGTLGFFVNVAALKGKPVPQSWSDLLKPEYDGLVGYLDPSSAAVGYVGLVAANLARGGTLDDFSKGIDYFKALQKNHPIVPKQTSYARVLSGEIPILIDFDFNAYRAKYKDHCDCAFVIPKEGSVVMPYVMALVKDDPHPAEAKKVLDYLLSDAGQRVWANAFLRPVFASAMPKDVAAKFLPEADYARAHPVDYQKMAAMQKAALGRYLNEVH